MFELDAFFIGLLQVLPDLGGGRATDSVGKSTPFYDECLAYYSK